MKTCAHCLRPFEPIHPLQDRCLRINCRKVEKKLSKIEKKTLGRNKARLQEKPREAKVESRGINVLPKKKITSKDNPFALSKDALRRLGTRSKVPYVDSSLERTSTVCLRCGVNHVPLLPWKGHVLTRLCEGCFMKNTKEDY